MVCLAGRPEGSHNHRVLLLTPRCQEIVSLLTAGCQEHRFILVSGPRNRANRYRQPSCHGDLPMSNYCVSERNSGRLQQPGLPTGDKSAPGSHPVVQQLRRVVQALSPWRPHRASMLDLRNLSEHLRRDIGLTNHVEQPPPGWDCAAARHWTEQGGWKETVKLLGQR